jgi:flagellar FliJ protein
MTRSERLIPVSRIAENREKKAAAEMVEFRRLVDAQQAKLDELHGYRNDYAKRLNDAGRKGMDAQRLIDYQRILAKLGDAISWQEKRLTALKQDYEVIRRRWTDSHSRTAALEKAMARFHAEERRAIERKEQWEMDEQAQRSGPVGETET